MGTISVQVVPRSSKVSITTEGKNSFKVKLTSPPVDGAANKQLIEVLAGRLSVPKRTIEIVSGEHSRRKMVQIAELKEDEIARRLAEESR